jgi:hypothetical protein
MDWMIAVLVVIFMIFVIFVIFVIIVIFVPQPNRQSSIVNELLPSAISRSR